MSHIDFRAHCVTITQKDYPYPYHMCSSQNFDKIDSFVKSVLNIFILRNLIVGWVRGLLVLWIKSIDSGEVVIVNFIKVKVDTI